MKNGDLQSMSVDELWTLYELVGAELSRKTKTHRTVLESRLRALGLASLDAEEPARHKRTYPKVLPKYRNPNNTARHGPDVASSRAG
jgi:DNA-binding protein H-NS